MVVFIIGREGHHFLWPIFVTLFESLIFGICGCGERHFVNTTEEE